MGDSATPSDRGMREAPGVRRMSCRQADGYVRRLKFIKHLTSPKAPLDIGKDYTRRTFAAFRRRLVAHRDLHPALVGPPS